MAQGVEMIIVIVIAVLGVAAIWYGLDQETDPRRQAVLIVPGILAVLMSGSILLGLLVGLVFHH